MKARNIVENVSASKVLDSELDFHRSISLSRFNLVLNIVKTVAKIWQNGTK